MYCQLLQDSTLLSLGCETTFWQSVSQFAGEPAFRNIGLLVVAVIGIGFAIYRSVKLHQQTKTAIRQAETSEAGLNIDRFQKGVEMLGHEGRFEKQAGASILFALASSNPREYFINVFGVLLSYVYTFESADISQVLQKQGTSYYNRSTPEYSTAIICLLKLNKVYLDTKPLYLLPLMLHELLLVNITLENYELDTIDFTDCKFGNVDFKCASLVDSNMEGVTFIHCKNLTYAQLSQAKNVDSEFLAKLKADEDQAAAEASKSDDKHTPS